MGLKSLVFACDDAPQHDGGEPPHQTRLRAKVISRVKIHLHPWA